MMLFDRTQVEAFYAEIKNSEDFPQAYCEELFLVGKFTEDTALQQEVGKLLEQNFDATVGKAYKKRKGFPNPKKYNAQTVIETLFVYGEISPTLDLDKMYRLAGFRTPFAPISDKWDSIPEIITRFQSFTELSLGSYYKTKVLPDFLDKLVNLEKVEIEAEGLTEFPMFITRLPALKSLELKMSVMPNLPTALFEIESLEELDIRASRGIYDINANIVLTANLGKLKNLKKLRLYYFTQDSLPDDFFEGLDNLEELQIGRFPNLKHLPTSICKLKNLKILGIHVMGALQELPTNVSALENLKEVKLGTITDMQIPVEIFALPALENIGFHNMTNMQIQTNHSKVSNLKSFRLDEPNIWNFFWENVHLFVHIEELTMRAMQSRSEVPDKISVFQNLRMLALGGDFCRISEEIGALQNLEYLQIHNASSLEALPESLAKLVNLKELGVQNFSNDKKLVGKASCLPASPDLKVLIECKEFVIDLAQAHPLQDLNIRSTTISKSENLPFFSQLKRLELTRITNLPAEIGELTNLEYLYLSGEFDSVPDSIGKLQNLQEAIIWCKEKFAGLPDSFGTLANLRKLLISKYNGTNLEAIFSGLTNLEKLALYHFDEMQSLPTCFARLTKLEELKLENCEKLEKMGEVLEKMTSLKKLKLYFVNPVHEDIYAIAKLKNVEHLELLYWKNLEALPPELTALTALKVLSLDNTSKIHTIPDYIDQFQHLHTLILEGLHLETLPTSLVNLPHLTQMSISSTWFDAPLPEELRALRLQKLGNWQSKFSGHNQKKAVYEVLLSAGTQMVKSLT